MTASNHLDRLRQLSGQTSPLKVAERGSLRVQLGFVEEGLDDLKRAAAISADSYWIEAQLAEAHRVYVRDVMLSTQERLGGVHDYLRTECVARFGRASRMASASGAPPRTIAWIHAHAGAAQALLYFVMASSGARKQETPALFGDAMRSFDAALAAEPDYAWCIHLKAYLKTLRGQPAQAGEPGDFESARALLTRAQKLGGMTSAALERNLAMLHSYEAASLGEAPSQSPDLDRGKQAANDSIQHGFEVMRQDPDDPFAAYIVAASLGWLHLRASQADCREHLVSAISAARIRARNALARTYATLAGLALLDHDLLATSNTTAQREASDAEREARAIFERFANGDPAPDVETWAMLNRDPIWRSHPFYRDLLERLSEGLDVAPSAAE